MKLCLSIITFVLATQALVAQSEKYPTRMRDTSISRKVEDVIIEGYVKKNSPTVNRMPLKAIENSQVFSSIDRVALENQQITTVDDGFRNVVGLQKMWNATNRGGDGGAYVNLRGFVTNNSLRDGYVAPVTSMMDAINVEKIEVLKGPSATLFGTGPTSYGGVINRVTKKPYEEFGGQVAIFGGSFNHYRAQADINTPLNNDNSLLFRLNTAYTNTGTFQKADAKNQFFILAPSFTWRVNDRLDINLEYEHFENKAIGEQNVFFWFPPSQLGYRNMRELVDDTGMQYRESYIGDGLYNTGRTSNLFATAHYQISERILSTTAINKAYNKSDGRNPFFYVGRMNLFENTGSVGLHQADQSTTNSHQDIFQIQQNFNFDGQIGAMRNRLVVGGDYMRTNNRQMFLSASTIQFVPFVGGNYSTFDANLVDAYYQNLKDQGSYDAATFPFIDDKDTYSFYASNVLTVLPGLNVMAALRYETNHFLGGNSYNTPTEPYKQSGWSPKFGAVYEIVKDKFSVFGNYQNSFTSNGYFFTDVSGAVALSKPETANQWEGGFKADLLNGRVNASLSYYDITVQNSIQSTGISIPGTFNFVQNQLGERISRGVELEVNAYLVKGFTVIGGVSYNDSRITETSDASISGRRPTTGAAPWQANFYANYNFLDGTLKGLAFGFGGNHVGAIPIFNTTTDVFELPKYTVLNANAYYDYKQFRFGVRMDNLANEQYWIGYSTANAQPSRNIIGNVTYRF